jgi:hypothetical protein
MAKLTKKRAALKPSQFGLPEKARTNKARKQPGNYPMPRRGPRDQRRGSGQEAPQVRQALQVGLPSDATQGAQDPQEGSTVAGVRSLSPTTCRRYVSR